MKQVRDPDAFRAAMASRRGLSYRELAVLANVSHPTIVAILSGNRCAPAIARRLARILGIPVDRLFQASVSSGAQPNAQAGAVA